MHPMESPHNPCSLHGSRPERNIDRPQLPGFEHLLQSLGYPNRLRDSHPSLNLLLTPASVCFSEDASSSRSVSEDTTSVRDRTRSLKENRALKPAGEVHNPGAYADDLSLGDAGRIFDRPQSDAESLPSGMGDCYFASGHGMVEQGGKSFVVRNYPPAPMRMAVNPILLQPGSWQDVATENRMDPRYVADYALIAQSSSSPGNRRLINAPIRRRYKRPQSFGSSRAYSQLPTPKSSTSPLNRAQMKDSHTIVNAPMATVDVNQPIMPKITQKRTLNNISHISTMVPLRDESLSPKLTIKSGKDRFNLGADPATAHTGLTRHYLDTFFDEINVPAFNMLPRTLFMIWAMDCTTKSMLDRIMLYALMSWASLHSTRSSSANDRAALKAVIYENIEVLEAHRCLQSVHALLFLAFTEYGDHQYRAGSDAFARCVDTMTFLELNVEQIWKKELTVYELPIIEDAECRRRTFWVVFCSDVHIRQDQGSVGIRLPYTNGFFDCEFLPRQSLIKHDPGVETMVAAQGPDIPSDLAHVIEITRIYANVLLNTLHPKNLSEASGPELDHMSYQRRVNIRLKVWADAYHDAPRIMRNGFYDAQNMFADPRHPRSRTERIAGLDMLYHNSHMELNRRIHHSGLSNSEVSSHARNATTHALAALRLTEQVMNRGGSEMKDYRFVARGFSTVYAITDAVEIITAVGKIADVLEPGSRIMSLMYSALALLDQLGSLWGHDLVKYREVAERIQSVYRSSEAALEDQKRFFYCSDPIISTLSREFDLIYGTNRKRYLQLAYPDCALIEDKDIFEINTH